MKRDKSQRHPHLAALDVPHTGEHVKDDGTFDIAAAERDLPKIVKAIKGGKLRMRAAPDQTDPDQNGNFDITFHMHVDAADAKR